MAVAILLTSLFAAGAAAVHFASIAVVIRQSRRGHAAEYPPALPVSIVRPVCGLEPFSRQTLQSAFELDFPDYEILMCVARGDDPVVPTIEQLIREYTDVPARLLIGNNAISANPKLNNCVKGWRAARHPWVILADSNVLMPEGYVQTLFDAWRDDTGLVCSPPIGALPQGFVAELECQVLNTHQARWQLFANAVGVGFAQGKSMLWNKAMLDRAGGIAAIGAEAAEDAAATKLVRNAGLNVRLVDRPFPQPVGIRSLTAVWNRQLRWARLRRASFPLFFFPEILAGAAPPIVCLALAMIWAGFENAEIAWAALAFAACWYGAEAFLARAFDWHLSALSPLAWLARDIALPVLWVAAWIGDGFVWHGHEMSASQSGSIAETNG